VEINILTARRSRK